MNKRKYTDEQFIEAVKTSFSIRQLAQKLNLRPDGGGTYYGIKNTVLRLKLDISHFTGQRHAAGKHLQPRIPAKPLSEILVLSEQFLLGTHDLKLRLIKENILQNICAICKTSEWQGRKLSLHLDHINGNRKDNRVENLRLLCPNCHSQTETYCGKNIKPTNKCKLCPTLITHSRVYCKDCFSKQAYATYRINSVGTTGVAPALPVLNGNRGLSPAGLLVPPRSHGQCSICQMPINNSKATKCSPCHLKYLSSLPKKTKIQWPEKSLLEKLIWEMPTSKIAKDLGISDKAIEKRCKKLGITKPPRGHWQKQ